MSKTPKLRFPEFSGEWEETTLGNVSLKLDYGMGAAAKEYDGKNKYIRITDIDEETNKYNNKNIVSPEGELDSYYLVKENDLLLSRTGASTGKSYIYDFNDGILYFAGFLIRARISKQYNSKFVFLQTLTSKYNRWVKIMSMRSGQPGINAKEYSEYKFYIPSLQEQQKIASFLSLVDKKIEKQSEKVEAIKEYKKGMMQKIFSREIRFKDDEGKEFPEWEEKKLGEVVEYISSGKTKDKKEEGKYKVYGSTGVIGITNKADYQGEHILIARVGANAGFVNIVDEECGVSDNTLVIKLKDNMKTKFLYYLLKNYDLSRLIFGSGQPLITGGQLKNINFPFLIKKEQQKIANFLSTIDKKLEKEEEKLEALKTWKKGLLQQMFV